MLIIAEISTPCYVIKSPKQQADFLFFKITTPCILRYTGSVVLSTFANSEDPDGYISSGSTLFAKTKMIFRERLQVMSQCMRFFNNVV